MEKKIKILHIIPRFVMGGAERLVLNYFNFLPKDKFDIRVASGVEDGELRMDFSNQEKIFVGSRKNQGGRIGAWKKLVAYVAAENFDIVHTHLNSSDFFGWWLKKQKKIKWISTQHNWEGNTAWPRQLLWRLILPTADRVLAVSSSVYEYTRAHFGVKKDKLTLLLNGIDLTPYQKSTEIFLHKEITISTIGRLEKQKGYIYLLRALAQLKDLSWRWVVCGAGSEEKKLKFLAKKLDIENRIVWLGMVKNIPEVLSGVDLVVQPSLWEGMSLAVMEAMAAGKAIVTTTAAADLIDQGKTGWLVHPHDSAALAEAIREIFSNPDKAKECGRAARIKAHQDFSFSKHLESLVEIYYRMLAE